MTSNSVITRKSQRPLSVRKEIGRSRCENLLSLPLTPRYIDPSDEEDGTAHSIADSGSEISVSNIISLTKLIKILF